MHCLLFLFFTMCCVQVCLYFGVPFPYGINVATNVTRRHRRPEKATKIQACSPLATISACTISRSSEHVAQKAKLFCCCCCYCFFFFFFQCVFSGNPNQATLSLIGASLSEPHIDEFAVNFLYIYIYIYISLSYVVP